MNIPSSGTPEFWQIYHRLPAKAKELARKNYLLWSANAFHPSLRFKPIGQSNWSARVGDHSFTNAGWEEIEQRCRELKCGRSQYFQMLVEANLMGRPEIHAHKADGKWHFYPEKTIKTPKK